MDLLAALRIYAAAYRTTATQLRHPRVIREWMETMADCRAATREELEQHARTAAEWANLGYTAEEAAPLIADGLTPATVRELEQHAEAVAGGRDALAAQRIARMVDAGEIVDPDRVIRVQDPTDPTREIIAIRDDD